MKFKISLLIVLFGIGQSVLPIGLEQKYEKNELVEFKNHKWNVTRIENIQPRQRKLSKFQASKPKKIYTLPKKIYTLPKKIYTFERPIIPYLLIQQFKQTHQVDKKEIKLKVRSTKPSYKVTPFGGLTLGSVSLLALYGLYSYCSSHCFK